MLHYDKPLTMIKFFRKIRQDLLSKGKTGKYLKYAIGEIILVVIGILIALGINNLNARKNDRNKEVVYLNRLTTNLNSDIRLYNLIIKKDSSLIKDLEIMNSDYLDGQNNGKKTISNLSSLFSGYHFTSNSTTIDNIISSGKIEIIRSNYLLEDIFLYYRTTDDIEKGIDEAISEYNRAVFGPLIIELDIENLSDKQKIKFKNSINMKIDLLNNQLKIYSSQRELAKNLLNKINKELELIR
ncbi:MAG: hypothetical protein K9I99_01850 [Melioribacteraceae bacterium]|nr:hypothetical protein [Melioribacteraceae bacterium]MCF8431195.1 hypothetical protein [Melioribacteraceae bacterium]